MMATLEAAKTELQAAQDVGAGNFAQAQSAARAAEENLRDAGGEHQGRRGAQEARRDRPVARRRARERRRRAGAAPSAVRDDALRMNGAAMKAMGY